MIDRYTTLLYDSSLRNEEMTNWLIEYMGIFELLLLSFFSRVQGRLLRVHDIFVDWHRH